MSAQPEKQFKHERWECNGCGQEINIHSRCRHIRKCQYYTPPQPTTNTKVDFFKRAEEDDEMEIHCYPTRSAPTTRQKEASCKVHEEEIQKLREEVVVAKAARHAMEYDLKRSATEIIRLEVRCTQYDSALRALLRQKDGSQTPKCTSVSASTSELNPSEPVVTPLPSLPLELSFKSETTVA